MDAVYDQVRRLTGASTAEERSSPAPERPVLVAEGIRAVPVRTPTLPPATHTGCYLIGDREVIAVDPASPYVDEQGALDAILDSEIAGGARLIGIALTHHHGDHVGGAVHLARRYEVPILAHATTAELLAGWVPVDRTIAGDEVIDLAGTRVTALWTPGHAAGHLCFEVGRTIVAGDMVAGIGTILIDPDEGDMAEYLRSLEAMAARAPAVLLPSHGPAILDGVGKLRAYIQHRLMREARVAAAVRAQPGATAGALVGDAYADTPGVWPALAERSLLAHLKKLEVDGVVRRDGNGWTPS
jgi:glyoxylase-like metal-dependent hydrolase (beta-lactamase superfamily II)